ncbi:MAG: VOC family protein, partial [Chloroflexota bacterium]
IRDSQYESQEITYMRLSFFGPGAKFHHVGLVVQDAAAAGITDLERITDPIQRVSVGFVSLEDCCIELIEPLGEDSPVINSLRKGLKYLHLCFEVEDLGEALRLARIHGFKIIHDPTPATAFAGREIAWLWHEVWGVIELLASDSGHK